MDGEVYCTPEITAMNSPISQDFYLDSIPLPIAFYRDSLKLMDKRDSVPSGRKMTKYTINLPNDSGDKE